MRKLELDDQGKVNIGPVSGVKTGAINVAFASNDTAGVALNVEASPAAGSAAACIKLGGYTIGQDVFGNGGSNFAISDSAGVTVFSAEAGADKLTDAQAMAAFAAATAVSTLYHMQIDKLGLDALAVIDGTTPTDAVFWARANALKAAFALHFAGVGSLHELGEHKVAETTAAATLAAVPAATNTATACTLAIAIGAALIDHGNQSGIHFHDDATAVAYTATSDLLAGNATKALCVTELDALLAAMLVHVSNGAYEIPA